MSQEIITKFNDRAYRIRYTDHKDLGQSFGECDSPADSSKVLPEIRISDNICELMELETTIHEALHACGWELLAEEFVQMTGRDIAKALYSLGWRKEDPDQ